MRALHLPRWRSPRMMGPVAELVAVAAVEELAAAVEEPVVGLAVEGFVTAALVEFEVGPVVERRRAEFPDEIVRRCFLVKFDRIAVEITDQRRLTFDFELAVALVVAVVTAAVAPAAHVIVVEAVPAVVAPAAAK